MLSLLSLIGFLMMALLWVGAAWVVQRQRAVSAADQIAGRVLDLTQIDTGEPRSWPESGIDTHIRMVAEEKHAGWFHARVAGVGVTNDDGTNRQQLISTLVEKEPVYLLRDPANLGDPNAVRVMNGDGRQLGLLAREIACDVAPAIDEGVGFHAIVCNRHYMNAANVYGLMLVLFREGMAPRAPVRATQTR